LNPAIGFKTLYNFTGGEDGCCIYGGVARDKAGNLYSVADLNQNLTGSGGLFKLTPGADGYAFEILQSFGRTDAGCMGTPAFDAAGNLFGLCSGSTDEGTLWEYSNRGQFSVLHTFYGPVDGMNPRGSVAFDNAGNIYGTAPYDGIHGGGTLWEYSAAGVFSVLHDFTVWGADGSLPTTPRIAAGGLLWGTSVQGPDCLACGNGTIWNYDPASATFTVVADLANSTIKNPLSRLALDSAGNLYGTAYALGAPTCGVVYELSPGNNYQPVILYHFTKVLGCSPLGDLVFDPQGNLFGTTCLGGALDDGVVYELKLANGVWKETLLHSFSGLDGASPFSGLTPDGAGDWFGTTEFGGSFGQGSVFEISGVK
jgi:uncharacterized repeat protein (TIGR03803 family)